MFPIRRCESKGELVQTQECNVHSCTGPAKWSEWSDFDKCSATCSGGRQTRYRYCIGGEPGSEGCEGLPEEAFECNTEKCESDEVCPDSMFDVAFLIEANALVEPFQTEVKDFIKSIITEYKSVSPGDVRLCVIRFTSWPDLLHPFSSLTDINSALAAIDDIAFYGKGADLTKGIETMEQQCFDESNGWRGTTITAGGVPSQAIILTHSDISDVSNSVLIELKTKVQRVMVVEIDGIVGNNQMLASAPAEENMFHLSDFASLPTVVAVIVEKQCRVDLWPDECYGFNGKGKCDAIGF